MAERGLDQYPNSTPGGDVLPFNVGNISGLGRIDVTDADSDLLAIEQTTDITLIATFIAKSCDIIVDLNGSSCTIATDTFVDNLIFIPKGGTHSVLLLAGSSGIVAKAATASATGTLWIQVYRAWKASGISALQSSF